ncbi:hypothetical protein F4677DRAFT_383100 [Hypoxylon crocopeplum]|nr:hypothetical protein F4677DRAFT_383100 [Hypoxylon crocopeplum]
MNVLRKRMIGLFVGLRSLWRWSRPQATSNDTPESCNKPLETVDVRLKSDSENMSEDLTCYRIVYSSFAQLK